MAKENVTKFEDLLRESEELQAKLSELGAAFAGDRADEQAVFDATIGKLAAEAGLPFTLEEGRTIMFAEGELSDEELDAVAGGGGFCYVIGGSDEPEATCGRAEFHVCAYLGFTIPDLSK